MAAEGCRSLGPSQEPSPPWWVLCQCTDGSLLNRWYYWMHFKFWHTFLFNFVRKFFDSSIYECLVSMLSFRFCLVCNLNEVFWIIFLIESWCKCFWILLHYHSPEFAHLLKECLTWNCLSLLTPGCINWCPKRNVCFTHWKKSNCWFNLIEIILFDFFLLSLV